MSKDAIEIELSRILASYGMESDWSWGGMAHTQHSEKVEMKTVVEEMLRLQAEPWPIGAFGG